MGNITQRVQPVVTWLTLGSWVAWAIGLTGLTAAVMMGWAFAQLNWFWTTFRWAGVLFVGLVTWFLVGVGLNLYRQEQAGGRRALDPWLIGAVISALALIGCLVGYALTSKTSPAQTAQTVPASSAPAVPLPDPRVAELQKQNEALQNQLAAAQKSAAAQPQSAPQSQSPRRIYTLEALQSRQRALSQLSDYLAGMPNELRTAADDLIGGLENTLPIREFLQRAQAVKALLGKCVSEQTNILGRYDGIDDIFNLTDWNYFTQKMEPALEEYIATVRALASSSNSPDLRASLLGNTQSRLQFAESVGGLRAWLNNTRVNIGKQRSEYDRAEVYK